MSDFNIFSHLNTMGFGRGGKNDGPPDPANEKESPQIVVDAAGEKVAGLAAKMLGAPNLSQLGQVGLNQQFEYKGWADSTIPSLVDKLNSRGGIIAQIAHTLVKNGVIQDQSQFQDMAQGVGGDALLANSGNFSPSSSPNEAAGPGDDRGGGMAA